MLTGRLMVRQRGGLVPVDIQRYFAVGEDGGVYYSDDSWTNVTQVLQNRPYTGQINGITTDPANGDVYICGNNFFCYRGTVDTAGAITWVEDLSLSLSEVQALSADLSNADYMDLKDIHFHNGNLVVSGTGTYANDDFTIDNMFHYNGSAWIHVGESGTNQSPYRGIAYDGTNYFFGGENGGIRYSTTLAANSIQSASAGGTTSEIFDMYYDPQGDNANGPLYVAVGTNGFIRTATNLTGPWTDRSVTSETREFTCVRCIADSNGATWIAGGTGELLYVSTDGGVTWVAGTNSPDWAGENLFAFETDGTRIYGTGQFGQIRSTTNGTAWTGTVDISTVGQFQLHSEVNAEYQPQLHYSSFHNKWYAAGTTADGGTEVVIAEFTDDSTGYAAISGPDFPQNWAETLSSVATDGAGRWVLGTVSSSATAFYSWDNGETWNEATTTPWNGTTAWAVHWHPPDEDNNEPGVFILSESDGEIYYSYDGDVWTLSNITASTTDYVDFITNPNNGLPITIGVGSNGDIIRSTDGRTWSSRTAAGGFTGVFYDVGYGRNQFVAAGAGGEIQTSSNGITWTQAQAAFGTSPAEDILEVFYDPVNDDWYAWEYTGVMYLNDGVTTDTAGDLWNRTGSTNIGITSYEAEVIWDQPNSRFLFTGDTTSTGTERAIWESTNGQTWTAANPSFLPNMASGANTWDIQYAQYTEVTLHDMESFTGSLPDGWQRNDAGTGTTSQTTTGAFQGDNALRILDSDATTAISIETTDPVDLSAYSYLVFDIEITSVASSSDFIIELTDTIDAQPDELEINVSAAGRYRIFRNISNGDYQDDDVIIRFKRAIASASTLDIYIDNIRAIE